MTEGQDEDEEWEEKKEKRKKNGWEKNKENRKKYMERRKDSDIIGVDSGKKRYCSTNLPNLNELLGILNGQNVWG